MNVNAHEPIELDGVPPQEDVSTADAAERVQHDPRTEPNWSGADARRLREAATGIADRTDPEES
jgi:hypothetical protein